MEASGAPMHFSHLWQQETLSDVRLAVRVEDAQGTPTVLTTLLGHMAILSASPYFMAQNHALLQQSSAQTTPGVRSNKRARTAGGRAAAAAPGPPTVVLTLRDADQQPAAMAVLAALYGVKPPEQLLQELPVKLQAAVLADVLQLPQITKAAVDKVAADLYESDKASAALEAFVPLSAALPPCLYSLIGPACGKALTLQQQSEAVKQAAASCLLSLLGNLEAVWSDDGLRKVLLNLPLEATELLLSQNGLQVVSEDTVFYTAHQYMNHQVKTTA